MLDTGIIGLLLIVANFIVSYIGFKDHFFFDKYKFEVEKILIHKDYKRLITSGFLHVSWLHLILNMICLYLFSGFVETYLGELKFIIIYCTSLIGGNLLSLFINRNHADYAAVGASGATSGIVFAFIALFPGAYINFFILPISLPCWLYGILFIAASIYGIKSRRDNIGHEAHLGGALIGMATALLMHPSALIENYVTILIITLPAIVLIYLIITRPNILLVDNLFFKKHQKFYSIDHKYNAERLDRQKELNKLLDKINKKGMDSLSEKEKENLKKYSMNID